MINFRKIYALKPLKPILLLSHMRAYTSLISHILGSNPEINGYYEMHIGYYSWKSLIRQKLRYLKNHELKPSSRYIFDKVLHNSHHINSTLFKDNKAHTIITLREPAQTIPSIISLFNQTNKNNECATFIGAVEYYRERLNQLALYSTELKGSFIYFDAENIKHNTQELFSFIQDEIVLKHPLSAYYDIQKMTGVRNAGDLSKNIKEGKIITRKNDYNLPLDSQVISELQVHYADIRKKIISNSKSHL